MRIFMSHSSKHKPLVREITHYLPAHVLSWIDEKQLLVGENITESIKDAIEVGVDFVILFVDLSSATSAWVRKELEWALDKEARLGRKFILPIVLDKEAWDLLEPATFRERKYVTCSDFSEDGIRNLADNLSSHLFAWLSRGVSNQQPETKDDPVHDAEVFLANFGAQIRAVAHLHDKSNPMSLTSLLAALKDKPDIKVTSEQHLRTILLRLRQHGYLAGLVCAKDQIFIDEAYYNWKTSLFSNEKSLIAKRALEFIDSGSVIALDAGSTTISIAHEICDGIRMRSWEHLTVVTNSLSAASEILATSEEIGLEDSNGVIQVYIIGGRIRCNTLAVVTLPSMPVTDFDLLLGKLGGATACFVGANGIDWEYGFTTHDNPEIKTKKAMISGSQRRFVVSDPSKFNMKQPNIFASFDDRVEVITTRPQDEDAAASLDARFAAKGVPVVYAN
jgi:DeoR/GlpR family transcriptional regulator of sugar metabolism